VVLVAESAAQPGIPPRAEPTSGRDDTDASAEDAAVDDALLELFVASEVGKPGKPRELPAVLMPWYRGPLGLL
jgi:hypothetical protein